MEGKEPINVASRTNEKSRGREGRTVETSVLLERRLGQLGCDLVDSDEDGSVEAKQAVGQLLEEREGRTRKNGKGRTDRQNFILPLS